MDLVKILEGIENAEELVKQIEAAVGKEFVPRSEFNEKNNELKIRDKQLSELTAQLDEANKGREDFDKQIAELTGKVSKYELMNTKTQIAREAGLPFEFASRLTGDNEEALREDAKSLAKLIPRTPAPAPLKTTEPAVDSKDAALLQMTRNITNKGD